jgi:hypothetical protein
MADFERQYSFDDHKNMVNILVDKEVPAPLKDIEFHLTGMALFTVTDTDDRKLKVHYYLLNLASMIARQEEAALVRAYADKILN